MQEVTEDRVLETLKSVHDPDKGSDVVSLGMVQGIQIKGGHVIFALSVDPGRGPSLEPVRKEAEQLVHERPGVLTAQAILTHHREAGEGQQQQQGQQQQGQQQGQGGEEGDMLPGVKWIIAVASGKGGVGKSTTAANLALALANDGLRTGLFDADIFGPSMPRMLGINEQPRSPDGHVLMPLEGHGVKTMSIGFLVEEDAPIIWRGPMVMGALEQMMRDVSWGELDVMVIDMPPGTGDTQLTMSQRVPLTGAVIVSTPQDIALLDARKGLNMFNKVEVPVMGIIENMSYYQCPECGHQAHIFGHGGARDQAGELGVDFLGEIPLDIAIRETSDGGAPIVTAQPESPHARAYQDIARRLHAHCEAQESRGGPSISVT